jgi:hypothetical protein
MRGYVFFALFCVALAGPITSDFFNPAPKADPVPLPRMKYLSKYTNDELWRIQNQIIRQNQAVTSVRYAGTIFQVTRLTSDPQGPYVASCGDYQSNPSVHAFVNLATHLINTGVVADARVGGDNVLLLPALEPNEPSGTPISTSWANNSVNGVYSFFSSRGTWPRAVGYTIPASVGNTLAQGTTFDLEMPSSSAASDSAIKSLTVSVTSDNDPLIAATHFNFVFSLLGTTARSSISDTPCDAENAVGTVPTNFNATSTPRCFATKGMRYVDLNSPERTSNNAANFAKAINYGTHNGKVSYLEVMVTQASFNPTNPTFRAACQTIPQPTSWNGLSGYFPTRWCVRFDPLASVHVVSVDRFLPIGL